MKEGEGKAKPEEGRATHKGALLLKATEQVSQQIARQVALYCLVDAYKQSVLA